MSATTKRTRADDVRDRLRADILGGVLEPGERLKFPDLCQRYDTSVGAAREALTRLASVGPVQSQAREGFTVATISAEDLMELTRARAEIESLALRMSIQAGDMQWEAHAVAARHVLEHTPFLDPDNPGCSTARWAQAHADSCCFPTRP